MDNTYVRPYRRSELNPMWLEVIEYMGANVRREWLGGADEKIYTEFLNYPDHDAFYRETDVYIYHSTAYYLEGIKRAYYVYLLTAFQNKDATILDYGCGGGDDGLLFAALGFNVSLADVPCKTMDFAKWRAEKRRHSVDFYTIGADVIPRHDCVWCMDVLEHFPPDKQRGLIDDLVVLGKLAIFNLVNDPAADGRVHYPVDIPALTDYCLTLGTVVWTDFYGGKVRLIMLEGRESNE